MPVVESVCLLINSYYIGPISLLFFADNKYSDANYIMTIINQPIFYQKFVYTTSRYTMYIPCKYQQRYCTGIIIPSGYLVVRVRSYSAELKHFNKVRMGFNLESAILTFFCFVYLEVLYDYYHNCCCCFCSSPS